MTIERLRALEKKWRAAGDVETKRADGDGLSDGEQGWHHGRGEQYDNCADELATLIAELGQEVGAVPNGKLVGWWNGITPGFDGMGVPSIRWGADAENSRHDIPLYDGYNPIHYVTPPSSPAHTSEARDAVSAELERAVRKFPTWPTDPLHAVAVLGEEFGELTKAVLQSVYEPHKVKAGEVRMEAVQTAAMALRFLQSLDAYVYARCEQHSQDAAMRQEAGK